MIEDPRFPGDPRQAGLPPTWQVFPLQPQGKVPVTAHGVKDARPVADWGVKAGWPGSNCNIGLACGGASGVYVVDLDGTKGLGTWDGLEMMHGISPTLVSVTGSGGIHLVYSIPEALGTLPNTAGKLGVGIDTRGNGGYIVIPPSIHPSGTPYRWLSWREPEPLPQWIVDTVRDDRTNLGQGGGLRAYRFKAQGDDKVALRILREECQEVASATPGARNHTLFRCCCSMAELVGGGELIAGTVINAMTEAGIACGLSRVETSRTVHSAFKIGIDNPRIIRTRQAR